MAKFTVTYEFEDSTGYYPVPTQQLKFVSGEHVEDQNLGIAIQNIADDLRTILINQLELKSNDVSRGSDTQYRDGLIKILKTISIKTVEVTPSKEEKQ